QFRDELVALHAARAAGDGAAVVASATRLAEVYRGELLPIDIYEEWFEEDRTRARRDFCDAMVAGAQSAFDAHQHDSALVFLKRVSAIDPWREDVYQLMMRCQMFVGQRSGAIETYNVCRTRLVDDLGIDPCAETVRIFQAVLAMEDEGSFGPSSEI
ncbi:MAG: bacterial transcriptional activator domain-containing protein, partial [Coriobacteriia bacterium]